MNDREEVGRAVGRKGTMKFKYGRSHCDLFWL